MGRLGKGVHARSMILDGVTGVGKTVLLREFNYIAREQGWVTSGVVECDAGEQLPRIVAKLCHRALRDLDKRWKAGEAMQRAFGVLKAFTFTLGEDGKWRLDPCETSALDKVQNLDRLYAQCLISHTSTGRTATLSSVPSPA